MEKSSSLNGIAHSHAKQDSSLGKGNVVDKKALGKFCKCDDNLYFDKQQIFVKDQLKEFVKNGDLIHKTAQYDDQISSRDVDEVDDLDSGPQFYPSAIPLQTYYQPTDKLRAEISRMKEKYQKEKKNLWGADILLWQERGLLNVM